MPLPRFKYFPDPVAAGSIEPSETVCIVCKQARGYAHIAPIFGDESQFQDELDGELFEENICPWCIADGSSHRKFGVFFNANSEHGYYDFLGEFDDVPGAILEEITHRTPGIRGLQDPKWFFHCREAAEFLGPCGISELKGYGPRAIRAIREQIDWTDDSSKIDKWMEDLARDGSPRAYLFRCLHCGAFGGYSDCD